MQAMLTKLEDDSRAVPPWLCFHGSNGIDGALESFRAQARIGDIYSHTRRVSNITAQQTALAKSKQPWPALAASTMSVSFIKFYLVAY